MTQTSQYLRNPMTDDVIKADQALASKLRGYGWRRVKAEDYRKSFVKHITQNLMREQVN